ncbi:uncharacterized protein VTP21DRAFT_10301 [Calcarisporiella thermophila]|uniref:uncharacterized protein n=1 Tax=Calcarisporiella thermophila TaxID=911321 RepID=UPI0037443759
MEKNNKVSLKVIGAGLGRTGTFSLMTALDALGVGPTYHMVRAKHHHFKTFNDAYDNKPVDWSVVFEGHNSTVDWPTVSFYKQLMAEYPEAKVVLTVRDSPEVWYDSMKDTILQLALRHQNPSFGEWLFNLCTGGQRNRWVTNFIERDMGGRLDKEGVIAAYNRHVEEVKRHVPQERLLIFNVKQGWQPLCDFLGVEVPAEPFPNRNDRKEFTALIRKRDRAVTIFTWGLGSAVIALGAVAAGLYFKPEIRFFDKLKEIL